MTSASNRFGRLRRTWVSITFVILAALAAQGASTAYWVNQTMLDTDRFMDLVEPVLRSDAVASKTADWVASELVTSLEVEDRIESSLAAVDSYISEGLLDLTGIDPEGPVGQRLPDLPELAALAAPLASAIETRVGDITLDITTSDAFRNTLTGAVRVSHRGAVVVLTEDEEDLPAAISVDGDVKLDLRPVLAQSLVSIAEKGEDLFGFDLPNLTEDEDPQTVVADAFEARGITVPDGFGEVVIISEESLDPYRGAIKTLNRLVWLLFVLTVALGAAAIWANPDRTKGAVWLGVGLIVAWLSNWPITTRLVENISSGLDSGTGSISQLVFETASRDLRRLAANLIAASILLVGVVLYRTWRNASVGTNSSENAGASEVQSSHE